MVNAGAVVQMPLSELAGVHALGVLMLGRDPINAPVPAHAMDGGEKETGSEGPPLLVTVREPLMVCCCSTKDEPESEGARVKTKGGVAVMERLKVIVFLKKSSVTVIGMGAAVTDADNGTARRRIISLAHDEPMVAGGVQDAGLNVGITPAGRPVTLLGIKDTSAGVPDTVVTEMALAPVVPRRMLTELALPSV